MNRKKKTVCQLFRTKLKRRVPCRQTIRLLRHLRLTKSENGLLRHLRLIKSENGLHSIIYGMVQIIWENTTAK